MLICTILVQVIEKSLMKLGTVFSKTLQNGVFSKRLIRYRIMALYLLPCFCFLIKKELKSIAKISCSGNFWEILNSQSV